MMGLINQTSTETGLTKTNADKQLNNVVRDLQALNESIGAAPLIEMLTVATFGDSTADLGSITGSGTTDQSKVTVSLTTPFTSVNRIPTKWALSMFYPSARVIGVGGIGGQTTTQMIAREALAASSTRRSIMDVVNLSPDLVIYRGGSINDLIGFSYPTSRATIDALFDRHMQIVYTFISNGVRVIDEGFAGYSSSNSSNIRPELIGLNARISEALVGLEDRVRFLDPTGVTCGTDGAFLPGVSADGVHLNPFGQYRLGEAEAELIQEWFGKSIDISYVGVNLLGSTSQFATTTSPGFGVLPTGFSVNATNCTRQNAAIINKYGYRWATVEAVTTGADPSLQLILPFGIHAAGSPQVPIVVGGQYGIECRVMIETLDGSVLGTRADITGRVDIYNTNSDRLIMDISSTNPNSSAWSENHFIHNLVWPIWQSDENSADLTSACTWSINFWFNQGQNVRIGFAFPRIVKLN